MNTYDWAVIGAGPAGIATVGKLIDAGIDPKQISWIDPQFQVGDFGTLWNDVSSNTSVALFEKFYNECKAFNYTAKTDSFPIAKLNPKDTCLLELAAEPLRLITTHLKSQVNCVHDYVTSIATGTDGWQLNFKTEEGITSKNVVLATGAEPKSLSYPNITEIPITVALNNNQLKNAVDNNDTVAVFGSSHSAIIIIQRLLDSGVKQVINFYQGPLRYAVYFKDWILFDDTGLKGKTAAWARTNLDGNLPDNLQRYISNDDNLKEYLPLCNKAVYAVGFKRRTIPIEGLAHDFSYNPHCGIIAPGLFGIGIGFPEAKYDRFHNLEHRVGLWKFMDYLNYILPVWLAYPKNN
jgi:cation diffusion facilitator CzcD-associated flavoprotein CzcO